MTIRTNEQVNAAMKMAKLNKDDLNSLRQSVVFNDTFSQNSPTVLIELPNDVLTAVENGENLVINGRKEDDAVLCTKEATYSFREAEISNSLLLIDNLKYPSVSSSSSVDENNSKDQQETIDPLISTVKSIHFNYYELKQIPGNLRRLEQLLNENPYKGPCMEMDLSDDSNAQINKYTFKELTLHVQASEKELINGLNKIKAIEINGFWRLLDIDYTKTILDAIVNFQQENSWPIDGIEMAECCRVLGEIYPQQVISHVIKSYLLLKDDDDKTHNCNNIYSLKCTEFIKFIAIYLLSACVEFHLLDFFTAWKQSLPEEVVDMVDGKLLNGIALVKDQGVVQTIFYFPISKLPENNELRFRKLFDIKDKWKFDEILPYIRDLHDDESKVLLLLNKHTRCFTSDGVKMYTFKER